MNTAALLILTLSIQLSIAHSITIMNERKQCKIFSFNSSENLLKLPHLKNDIWIKADSDFKYLSIRVKINNITQDPSPAFMYKIPLILNNSTFPKGNWTWTVLDIYKKGRSLSKDTYILRAITMNNGKVYVLDTKLWWRKFSIQSMEVASEGGIHVAYNCNETIDGAGRTISMKVDDNRSENLTAGDKELRGSMEWIYIMVVVVSLVFIMVLIGISVGVCIYWRRKKDTKNKYRAHRQNDNIYEEIPAHPHHLRNNFPKTDVPAQQDQDETDHNLFKDMNFSSQTDVNWYSLYDIPKKPSIAVSKSLEGDSGVSV